MKPQEMDRPAIHWAGIDIAKDTFQMALWGHLDFRDMRVRGFQRQWARPTIIHANAAAALN